MKRALVLACGNPLRGDDGVALRIARALRSGVRDARTEIHSQQQWTPELAKFISEADTVIFVDASVALPPGKITIRRIKLLAEAHIGATHFSSPEGLLAFANALYGHVPQRAFLVTVGGKSFEFSEQLSPPVRRAVPLALDRIKALLSEVPVPPSLTRLSAERS